MSVYNPENSTVEEIERLELEARDIRQRIEQARREEDRRVLDRQLAEIHERIDFLKAQIP